MSASPRPTTNTSQQIGASVGTALLNTLAASATASYLAVHGHSPATVAAATVHGFASASAWAAGSLALGALVGGVLIDAHPGRAQAGPREVAEQLAPHMPAEVAAPG